MNEELELLEAKGLLSPKQPGTQWFGWQYTMNLYRGCSHGCIYCDSRCDCYRITDFDRVRGKRNAIALLDDQLRSKRERAVVGMGSMSDPYNPREREALLTRQALERIAHHGFGVGVATKSDLIVRDLDCYTRIAQHMPVIAKVTVTCLEDALSARIEPNAPSSSRRWAAVQALSNAGIFTGILLMPVLPWVTDDPKNIQGIIDRAADCGARFVYAGLGMTLRMNQRTYYYQEIDKRYPGLSARYAQVYGEAYHCDCPEATALWRLVERACAARGLLYRMEDIISQSQRPYVKEQMRLDGF